MQPHPLQRKEERVKTKVPTKTSLKAGVKKAQAKLKADVSSVSPTPVRKPDVLSFPDAIREVLNGKRITRIGWEDNQTYGLLKDGFLMISLKGDFRQWIVSDGDMEGIDWIVLPESN